ncbi:transketolase [Brevundimonas sp.]|uniref:transketolase n=1 Tax=Brevundimonas sp. TaxID=1871086 RepID=UPI002D2ED69B|nr:transketolase [Brevundimonas sp.]HYC96477.1 transketolase [Brevundimonas sp.]
MADAIRVLAMDGVEKAKSGHPGMPMGMADVATVLFSQYLKFDASQPDWADRDRFILSAGHGSMLIYALLHLTGYKAATKEELSNFRQWGSKTAGHPEFGHMPGVETTTGPLGQGLANSVGFAMAERHLAAKYGSGLVDHRTWVIAGDGCLMEGVSQEAITLAGRYRLNKLTVLWDDNEITIDGKVSLSDATDQKGRFKAAGWAVKAIDGHDMGQIKAALKWATRQDKPTLIACKTKIGRGAATMEGSHKTHGAALGAAEVAATRLGLSWQHEPFELPEAVDRAWKKVGKRGARDRKAWEARLAASSQAADFTRAMKGDLPEGAFAGLDAKIAELVETKPAQATRQSSGAALDELFAAVPELIGGSADLTGSNNTFVKDTPILDAPTYEGRYVNWGIREHGMAAAMNGMALHGGVIPYGGTFMVFSDYSRPSIRLAALMGIRVIHVLTHDSIGLGEDGPTHQPVEHLAALRAIPNLLVFRPADTVEAMECWRLALEHRDAPSALALSRQKTAAVRTVAAGENLSARGAYELRAANGEAKATLFATGTEVPLALKAAETLEAEGTPTRVVSVPCFELFFRQDAAYQASVLGRGTVRVAVEAAIQQGWERFIGEDGAFVGMTGFGASAPAEVLYEKFGITAEAVVAAVKARL